MLCFGTIPAVADSFMTPEPFEIWSDDGTMVFHWNPGTSDNWSQGTAQAGVYRNGELVYSVDNLPIMGESAYNFFLSQDFEHLIHMPTTGFEVALRYYAIGELENTYFIKDLVRNMNRVSHSVTMAFWRDRFQDTDSPVEHITEQDILRIRTVEGVVHTIDLTNGDIINSEISDALLYGLEGFAYRVVSIEASGSATAILVWVVLLLIFIGTIVLQIFLSKMANKWVSLILPFFGFIFSLVVVLVVVLNIIPTPNDTLRIIMAAVISFLLANIPTGIYLVIYAVCKGKRKANPV
jgi:hypothetical protein